MEQEKYLINKKTRFRKIWFETGIKHISDTLYTSIWL